MDSKTNNEQWLSSLLTSIPDALVATDKRGRVVMINANAEALLETTNKEVHDKPLSSIINILESKSRNPLRIPSPRVFLRNKDVRPIPRAILQSSSGKEICIDAILCPIKGYRGSVDGCVLVFRDVTDLIKKEQSLIEDHKIETIGNMAGSMALDFSNWLSIISGHASSVADNLIPNTRAHEDAIKILDAAEHAGRLTKRLSSIARAGTSDQDSHIDDVDLAEAVANACELMSGAFSEQQIIFKAKNLERAPYVNSNHRQLLDCLMNAFINSADAMPNGGTITLDASEKVLDGKSYVVLRIRDSGTGIPKNVLDRIFEPFFTTKKTGVATGLGLTVVLSSVQSWGGHVRIRSRDGQGTSLRLFLHKSEVQPKDRKKAQTGGETILIADDRQEILDEASEILTQAGYKVRAARGGKECVTLYRKHADDIHLSIIDVVMPDMDGKQVLSNIRKINPMAPIIMASGFSRDYVRGYLERGAWGFAQKPFERTMLLNTVRRVLDQKSERTT